MNTFRKVRYTDDGCEEFQCLACKARWEARSVGVNFCSHCGVKFDGQMDCREHYIPRWAYDRWGNHPPHDVQLHPQRKQHTKKWVIETRSRWHAMNGWADWSEWHYETNMSLDYDFKAVKSWIDRLRLRTGGDDSIIYQTEYRARLAQS